MTVDHPQFGTMCEICFQGLATEQCAQDTDGQRWDLCKGECARQAGLKEMESGAEQGVGLHLQVGVGDAPQQL